MNIKKILIACFIGIMILCIISIYFFLSKRSINIKQDTSTSTSIANPASEYCSEIGGTLEIKKKPDNSEYGVCIFEDNRQCEEWALFRKECKKGGVKITGYSTEATIYCAITGNIAREGTPEKPEATCIVKGIVCLANNYYKTGDCNILN